MLVSGRSPRYCAYLLRLWEECGDDREQLPTWRCSLEDPHTGDRRGFASLELLIAFLQAQLVEQCRSVDPEAN